MQVETRWRSIGQVARTILASAGLAGSMMLVALPSVAAASGPAVDVLDVHLVADLEQRAMTANPREQAFLYADLADKMTLLASRQIADGEFEKAEQTLQKLQEYTEKMESNFVQSKSLKKTELLLHTTNRRLNDMVRAASADVKPHVQAALQRLNAAQTALLTAIFAK